PGRARASLPALRPHVRRKRAPALLARHRLLHPAGVRLDSQRPAAGPALSGNEGNAESELQLSSAPLPVASPWPLTPHLETRASLRHLRQSQLDLVPVPEPHSRLADGALLH